MQQDIQNLKQSQRNRYLLEKRYPSAWYKKIAPKYKLLMEYFDCNRKELYSSIYKELEDTYDVDINQLHEDYCYENHLLKDECYPMDAIEHDTKLREALILLIDNSLIKYGLKTEEEIKNFKREILNNMSNILNMDNSMRQFNSISDEESIVLLNSLYHPNEEDRKRTGDIINKFNGIKETIICPDDHDIKF